MTTGVSDMNFLDALISSILTDSIKPRSRISELRARSDRRERSMRIVDSVELIANRVLTGNPIEAFEARSKEAKLALEDNPKDGLRHANKLKFFRIYECACAIFDRFSNGYRTFFEDVVIGSIMENICDQCRKYENFSIHIVFYHPGRFGTETILLIRLLEKIRSHKHEGSIVISIIDDLQEKKPRKFYKSLDDFENFLDGLSFLKGIELSVNRPVFSSVESYQKETICKWNSGDSSGLYDFFIGSDLGPISPDAFEEGLRYTGNENAKAIVLYAVEGEDRKEHVKLYINGNVEEIRVRPFV